MLEGRAVNRLKPHLRWTADSRHSRIEPRIRAGESLDDIVQSLVADRSLDEVHRRAGLDVVCEERERRFKDAEKK